MNFEDETLELSDPQFDFLESTQKHTGFVAGFGSGKSFIGTLKTLLKIIDCGIPKVAYYLPTYEDIKDIAFDVFPTVAIALGYEYELKETKKEFTLFDNKKPIGKVIFRNMSKPASIVGYQVGYTLIDETDILPQAIMDKAFKKILGRNRLVVEVKDTQKLKEFERTGTPPPLTYYHQKSKKLCWINNIDVAGTPEGYKWFYDRFITKFNPLTDKLIKASTYSNLHNLPSDFIETLRNEYPSNLFEAYVNGEFVNLTSGSIFYMFTRERNHSDIIENETEELYISQDFNIGGCVSVVYVKRLIDGAYRYIAVNEYESFDTRQIIINTELKYPKRAIEFTPDASGDNRKTSSVTTDIKMLKDAGYRVSVDRRNPYVRDRINIANNAFEKQLVYINCKRCPKVAKALEQHAYNEKGEPEKFTGAGTIDDITDGATYLIANKFPLSNKATFKQESYI